MATAYYPSAISMQIRLSRTQSPSLSSAFVSTTTMATILSSSTSNRRARDMVVRMGGGPRTFPGGVSKWQWKRMQEKKAKQLLKARLLRERQIYEMRKRAELKSALAQLERPWEAVEKAPNLLSVAADEQVKTLADRFQKPGGFDMWNERDGPQVFKTPAEGSASVRFFPKGCVHSIKPYTMEGEEVSVQEQGEELRFDDWIAKGAGGIRKSRSWRNNKTIDVKCTESGRKNDSKDNYSADWGRNGLNETNNFTENVRKSDSKENYSANRGRNGINISTKNGRKSGSKENFSANRGRNGSNGTNMIDVVSTRDAPGRARANASKNFSSKGGKAGVQNRKFVKNQHTLGSLGEKRGDTPGGQSIHKNISKNAMGQLMPVEGEYVKAGRNRRHSSIGNTKFRDSTITLRPSATLFNEGRRTKTNNITQISIE